MPLSPNDEDFLQIGQSEILTGRAGVLEELNPEINPEFFPSALEKEKDEDGSKDAELRGSRYEEIEGLETGSDNFAEAEDAVGTGLTDDKAAEAGKICAGVDAPLPGERKSCTWGTDGGEELDKGNGFGLQQGLAEDEAPGEGKL
ncbi:hypothetical protein ACH5RR_001753 [Cinchona calisaya]|uniref:Uncharacterized protein n=1 Tax=Cinchona calisaya TaxID=153742 RepID=A0ABD3B4P4_9GENT